MAFRRAAGFNLIEILIGLALAAVAVLTLLLLCTSALRSNQKTTDATIAATLARTELDRVVARVKADEPPGSYASFWSHVGPSPWQAPWSPAGTVTVEDTTFTVAIYAETVVNLGTGAFLGTGVTGTETPDNRVKKVDVVVQWWDEDDGARQGYGRLETRQTRLVKESVDN